MWPCSGTVFDDRLVERPHIRRLSGVATPLRHLLITPFQTDKLVEGVKALLRKAATHTADDLSPTIGTAIDTSTPAECANWFAAAECDAGCCRSRPATSPGR